jgi:sodium transport system permease protein
MGHKWGAIVASSLFFGATHGILQQSMTAFGVGIVIGYVAIQTGSLLPGIIFHFTYNSLSLLMAIQLPALVEGNKFLGWFFTQQEGGLTYHWSAIAASVFLTAAVLTWFRRLPFEASAEEALQDALDHQAARAASSG